MVRAAALMLLQSLSSGSAPTVPDKWREAIEYTDESWAAGLNVHCGSMPRDMCDRQMRDALLTLRGAYESPAATQSDRELTLGLLAKHRGPVGPDWRRIIYDYRDLRFKLEVAEGRVKIDPAPEPRDYSGASTGRSTTRCFTSVSKNGRRASTSCYTSRY